MDSFFGIGLPELVLILLLAGLIMGPQRIRQFARIFGRITAQLQRVSREFARQLNAELDAVDSGEMKNALSDVKSLQDEVKALRQELAQVPRTLREQSEAVAAVGSKAIKEGESALKSPAIKQDEDTSPSDNGDELPEAGVPSPKTGEKTLPNVLDVPGDPDS